MKNNLFILLVLLLFSSCHKEYRMEYMNGRDEKVREETFRFESDTVAYLKAYEEFCIAKKVEKEMIKKYGGNEEIISFKLYNEKGELITGEGIKDIKAKEEKIENQINEINNLIGEEEIKNLKIDSVKIKELEPFFNEVKDEFDIRENIFWEPKGKPKYLNTNWVYLYFSEVQGRVNNLRMMIQYSADEWLFIRKYIFSVDGSPIEMLPDEVKRDNGNGMIWEWCDQRITDFEALLVERLENASTVKIKFEGDNYYKVRTLSKKELLDIQRTIKLYKAKGGTI